jgi:hypothetical protein
MLLARHKYLNQTPKKFIIENKSVIFLEAIERHSNLYNQKSTTESEVRREKLILTRNEKLNGNAKVWKIVVNCKERKVYGTLKLLSC